MNYNTYQTLHTATYHSLLAHVGLPVTAYSQGHSGGECHNSSTNCHTINTLYNNNNNSSSNNNNQPIVATQLPYSTSSNKYWYLSTLNILYNNSNKNQQIYSCHSFNGLLQQQHQQQQQSSTNSWQGNGGTKERLIGSDVHEHLHSVHKA